FGCRHCCGARFSQQKSVRPCQRSGSAAAPERQKKKSNGRMGLRSHNLSLTTRLKGRDTRSARGVFPRPVGAASVLPHSVVGIHQIREGALSGEERKGNLRAVK